MDYTTEGYELDRTMRVITMRGSGHAQHPYRLKIEPGGLLVKKLSAEEAARVERERRGS